MRSIKRMWLRRKRWRLNVDSGVNLHAIPIFIYYRGMTVSVNLQSVKPRKLAAVRCEVAPGAIGSAWEPAVGKVWDFIRKQPGLWTDGHNDLRLPQPEAAGREDTV
jgi:hypothetical protein